MVSKAVESEILRRAHAQAAADSRSLAAALESGRTPSCLYQGKRVEILRQQDHPLAGKRYAIRVFPTWFWVGASKVSDIRGQVPTPTPAEIKRLADYLARIARPDQ